MLKRYVIILILFFTTTNLYASSLVDKNDKWPNAFDSLVLIQSMPSGFGISPYEQFFGEENHIINQFNRCAIFNSQHYHKAQRFFGNSIKDSRLTIIGFVS